MNLPSVLNKFYSKQLILLSLLNFFYFGSNVIAQTNSQNLIELRQQAESFLLEEYKSTKNERLEIKLGYWDRRLSLSACQQQISFSLQDPAGIGGNVTVNAQCNDFPGWTVHLPAQVDIYRPVLVATKRLNRGDLIQSSDLGYETQNLSQIPGDLLTIEEAQGKAAKRTINAGDPIKSTLLDQPRTVIRGQTVSITAKTETIQVVMQGTAMTDGKLGEQIRVKNIHSKRIISARVTGEATVEIL